MTIVRAASLFAVLALVISAARAAEPQGPAGLWRFDQCDGKIVKDASGRGNDGAIQWCEVRKEKAGASLELDGLGGHVLIREQAPLLEGAPAMTAAIWVRAYSLLNNTVLFGVPNPKESWTTPAFGMYADSGRIVYGLWLEAGKTKVLVQSPGDLPLETWTFLVGTYDGTTARLYINAAPAAEQPAHGAIKRSGQPLLIGMGLGNNKPSLDGRVGEFRLYDRALTAEEVRALYDETQAAYDLAVRVNTALKDGTVPVETHGRSPESKEPWLAHPTRLLELLDQYKPAGAAMKLDRFGGRMDRPQEKATGFFYVKKIDGRQWLIDPEGRCFYHVGINSVNPPRNAKTKFGTTEKWAAAATAELREAGFNGLGNGHAKELAEVKPPLVWVLRRNFMFEFARKKKLTVPAAGTQGFINKCMPVFHPEFEPFCEEYAKELAATATDPNMLGIMTDNELQCPVDLLDRYLGLDASNPDLKPGRDAAATWLTARKGSADKSKIDLHDRYEFIAFAFERYYRIVTRVIRKNDPNHLYLGSRINYKQGEFDNPWFWKMLAPYHDVVSVNYYGEWGPNPAHTARWAEWADRPILFTEWYAKGMDAPGLANKLGAGWLVRTQEDRARYYQHFVMGSLETPNVVGYHYFKYLDDPAESKALDSAGGANKGMFDLEGRPYGPLLERARAVNREVYPLIDFFDARNRRP